MGAAKMDTKLARFLEPVSAEAPCGGDLSFSAEFDRIQEARREDDPTVDYGEWQTTLKQADWKEVVATCTVLLQHRSKDLRLTAWLTEGLIKTEGLAGLAEGIDIAACLLERYGNEIHPRTSGGDNEQQIGTLSWFAMRATQLARQIPLTRSPVGQFSMNDHESALQLQRSVDNSVEQEHRLTLGKIAAAVSGTDRTLYPQWLMEVTHCIASLARLENSCNRLFGQEGPSFAQLATALDSTPNPLPAILNELGLSFGASPLQETQSAPLDEAIPRKSVMPANGVITSRQQALESLRQVATFFRQTEPHSPVAYLADKAALWGDMPLHVWLRAVMKDSGTLTHMEELLGVEMGQETNR